jgi:hypothetical protein
MTMVMIIWLNNNLSLLSILQQSSLFDPPNSINYSVVNPRHETKRLKGSEKEGREGKMRDA